MTVVGGVGLGVGGLRVVFFILSILSQAILMKVAWLISGGVGPSNSCRPYRYKPHDIELEVIVGTDALPDMARSSLKSNFKSRSSSHRAVGGLQ